MRWTGRSAVRATLLGVLLTAVPACSTGQGGGATGTGEAAPVTDAADGTGEDGGPVSATAVPTHGASGEEQSRMTLTAATSVGDPVVAVSAGGPVRTEVVTRDGGTIVGALDPWGRRALRFPALAPGPSPPRAVVLARAQVEGEGPLSPGRAPFSFGADFALDPPSEGTDVDNGDNLMQRGLASDTSQFKIDVDDGRPSCRVQGPDGVAVVRLDDRVEPEAWYRVRCSRSEDLVRLRLDRLVGPDATAPVADVSARIPTGDLGWRAGTPLSVGGKVGVTGEILRSSTDQFNGWVASPVVELTD